MTTAKIRVELGNTSNIKWVSGIGEIKINWGPGYRIYLAKAGIDFLILFGGGIKRGQQKDIQKALELHAEYQSRLAAIKKGRERKDKRRKG